MFFFRFLSDFLNGFSNPFIVQFRSNSLINKNKLICRSGLVLLCFCVCGFFKSDFVRSVVHFWLIFACDFIFHLYWSKFMFFQVIECLVHTLTLVFTEVLIFLYLLVLCQMIRYLSWAFFFNGTDREMFSTQFVSFSSRHVLIRFSTSSTKIFVCQMFHLALYFLISF